MEKKTGIRLLSFLMALVLCLSLLPMQALNVWANEDKEDDPEDAEAVEQSLNDDSELDDEEETQIVPFSPEEGKSTPHVHSWKFRLNTARDVLEEYCDDESCEEEPKTVAMLTANGARDLDETLSVEIETEPATEEKEAVKESLTVRYTIAYNGKEPRVMADGYTLIYSEESASCSEIVKERIADGKLETVDSVIEPGIYRVTSIVTIPDSEETFVLEKVFEIVDSTHTHTWHFSISESGDQLLAACTAEACNLDWEGPQCVAQLKVEDLTKTEDGTWTRKYDATEAVSAEFADDILAQLGVEMVFVEEEEEIIRKEEKKDSGYRQTDDVSNAGTYRVSAKVKVADVEDPFALSKEYEVTPRELKITGIVAENKNYDGTTAISFEKKEGSAGVKCSITGLANADKKASKEDLSISFTGKLPKADVQLNESGEEIPYDILLNYTINGRKKDNYKLTEDSQMTASCTVMRTSIRDAAVTLDTAFVANGEEQIRTVKQAVVTVGSKKVTLKDGTDYEVTGNLCQDAGKYTMTLTGKGNFKDSVDVPFYVLPDVEETDAREIQYGDGAAKLVVSDPDNLGVALETTLREILLKLPGDQLEHILLGDRVVWTLEATKASEAEQKALAKTVPISLKPGQYVKLTMTAKSAQEYTYREGFTLKVKMGISSKLQNISSGKRREFSVLMPVSETSAKVLQSTTAADEKSVSFSINTKEFNGGWYILAYKDVAVVTTGDSSPVVIVASILAVAIGGLGILLYFEIKSRKSGKRSGKFTD